MSATADLRYVGLVARHELRRRLRDPVALALMTLVPLGIAIVLRVVFGGGDDGDGAAAPTAEVLVVDRDASFVSELLLTALTEAPGELPLHFELVADETEARRRIDRGDGTALLIVPDGFDRAVLHEEPATLELIVDPSEQVLPRMVVEFVELLGEAHFYAHRLAGGLAQTSDDSLSTQALEDLWERLAPWVDPPRIDVVTVVDDEPNSGEAAKPAGHGLSLGGIVMAGLLTMTVLFSAQGLSEDLWVERTSGTLRRAQAAPRPLGAWVAGKLGGHAALFATQGALGLLIARHGFGVEFAGALPAIALMTLGGAAFTGLLLVGQTLASNQRAGSMIASLITYPLLMLGGGFMPLEVLPDGLRAIGERTPVGWALVRLKRILGGAADPTEIAVGLAVVALATVLLGAVTLRRLPGFVTR